ncbi:MAG: hypothetical protein Ct9H90mP20_6960 [Candidatus Neomarinimicrobiota bacterium]|nr:MAG: hypothetical protein Ct9H90mP20_6960 [Candidatus Neomarinimicrobiota bacterium]
MFDAKIYIERRKHLATEMGDGLIVLAGNKPVPMNYPSNTLRFRQDSNFYIIVVLIMKILLLPLIAPQDNLRFMGRSLCK